jgi:hypothetical protein
MNIPENRGTVTPASREKLEREVAALIETSMDPERLRERLAVEREVTALIDSCAKPRKLRDMLALLAEMDRADRAAGG